jgi:hypothetical protein
MSVSTKQSLLGRFWAPKCPPDVPESKILTNVVRVAKDLSWTDATDLMDWLQNHEVDDIDVTTSESGFFTVQWVETREVDENDSQ